MKHITVALTLCLCVAVLRAQESGAEAAAQRSETTEEFGVPKAAAQLSVTQTPSASPASAEIQAALPEASDTPETFSAPEAATQISEIQVQAELSVTSGENLFSTENASGESRHSANRLSTGRIVAVALPAAMGAYGAISLGNNGIRRLDFDLRDQIVRRDAFWHIRADNYVQFAPAAAAFALKGCGVRSAHGWGDMAALYVLSNAVAGGTTLVTKHIVGRRRPDNSNNLSFPSGHTQTAFVAAEFLWQEYKDRSIWIGVAGYGAAAFVGAARIMNDRHWLSDVVAGAGIGILSTKAVYWGYPWLKKTFCGSVGRHAYGRGGVGGNSGAGYSTKHSSRNARGGNGRNAKVSTILLPGYSNGILSFNLAGRF